MNSLLISIAQVLAILVPILAILAGSFLYRHNSKKEVLRFDLVQFIYSFIIAPVLFIWLKSFLFLLLRQEIDLSLSLEELFVIDTAFSTVLLVLYAFVVIHSLTASFNRKKYREPLYDLFKHSEYFHLWLSHLVLYLGVMAIGTVLASANIFFPLIVVADRSLFFILQIAMLFMGGFGYLSIWLSDPDQANFMRIMKLSIAFFFMIMVSLFFIFSPAFSFVYVGFWSWFMVMLSMSILALFVDRSEKATTFFNYFKFKGWDFKLYIFKK